MVQQVALTKDMMALVDDEDFDSIQSKRWHASRSGDKWYAAHSMPWTKIERAWRRPKLYLHRWITQCFSPKRLVDHYNGDSLDCRRENLIVCDYKWNTHNSILSRRPMSGFRGVSNHHTGCWAARIVVDGVQRHLGMFTDPEEAARAYDAAALEVFGPFARTNAREGRLTSIPQLPLPAVAQLSDCPF